MARKFTVPVGITALGQHYPDKIVTNQDLSKWLETDDEWIRTRTGIQERRWVEPGVGASDLAAPALRMALEKRGIGAEELDIIIVPTVTPDTMFPCTATRLQEKVGATKAWAFDLNAACSGFLYALTVAGGLVASRAARKVAVVGAEVMTSITDMEDRTTAVLFGDGAGAAIVEEVEEGLGILDFEHQVDGSGGRFLVMPAGGSLKPASAETVAHREHYIHQEGQDVFKNAVKAMADTSKLIADRNGLTGEDIALFVPHQANMRIMEAAAKRLKLLEGRMAVNIDKYANTTSATIPTALFQSLEAGRIQKGDSVILAAFGAGFTWGALLMKWAY